MWIFKLKNGFGIYLLDNIVFKVLRIEMFCFFRGFSTVIRWSASTLRPLRGWLSNRVDYFYPRYAPPGLAIKLYCGFLSTLRPSGAFPGEFMV